MKRMIILGMYARGPKMAVMSKIPPNQKIGIYNNKNFTPTLLIALLVAKSSA